jgi:hypothetical protein
MLFELVVLIRNPVDDDKGKRFQGFNTLLIDDGALKL